MISANVPINIPPTVPTPIEMLPLAPTPLANISGSIPNIIVSEVMRIGRRRTFAADMAAIVMDIPSSRFCDAYSVRRMAVFASSPMSMSRPICRYMLFSRPNHLAKRKLPARPKGTERMMAIGMNMLSYNAHRIRYMNTTQITKIMATELPLPASSRDMPPNSYPYPAGITSAATSRTAWIACPEL